MISLKSTFKIVFIYCIIRILGIALYDTMNKSQGLSQFKFVLVVNNYVFTYFVGLYDVYSCLGWHCIKMWICMAYPGPSDPNYSIAELFYIGENVLIKTPI